MSNLQNNNSDIVVEKDTIIAKLQKQIEFQKVQITSIVEDLKTLKVSFNNCKVSGIVQELELVEWKIYCIDKKIKELI